MSIEPSSETVLLAVLPGEPGSVEEIQKIVEHVQGGNYDVVISFSEVSILSAATISKLIMLERTLRARGRRILLVCVRAATKGVLEVCGLDRVFAFAEDQKTALAELSAA